MKKLSLLQKLLLGILAGILIGFAVKSTGALFIGRTLSTFNSIFGNFLGFMIPLIILTFVAPGISDLGRGAEKLLGLTALLAYVSTIVAGTAAFFAGQAILPRFIQDSSLAEKSTLSITPYFTIEMPAVMGVMSALILAFLLGIGMANIKNKNLHGVLEDAQGIVKATINRVIIPLIPLHICGIFAKLTATGEIFATMKAFSWVFALLLSLQVLYVLVQYLIAGSLSKKSPVMLIKNILPAYFTALGTQSSASTIPVSLEASRKNGVSEEIVDFVVPLGATIHLAGDTITLVLASMGVMLMSGTTPTFATMFPFILMLGVTMVAAPGIPGGGVMAALGLLERMLGFASGQQALMIAIHFAQDSFGTATNVSGDGALAVTIDSIVSDKKEAKLATESK